MSTRFTNRQNEDLDNMAETGEDATSDILTGGNRDIAGGSRGGPSRVIPMVGGRGATGGGSNANMGGEVGVTTAGTAGGRTPAATTDDLGISDQSLTGDLSATTAGPEGDMGEMADRMDAAVTGGATIGYSGDSFEENAVADTIDRGPSAPFTDKNGPAVPAKSRIVVDEDEE